MSVASSTSAGEVRWLQPTPSDPAPGESRQALRRILVCLDGSELGEGVVRHARSIADAFRAQLTLLRVVEENDPTAGAPPDALEWGMRRKEARIYLEDLVGRCSDSDCRPDTALIQGRAAEQICLWAEQNDVDLTVLCSHGAHGLTDWSLASTARKLIDRVPSSLLLVPAAAARPSAERVRYERILVPLDGSASGESALNIATRVAAEHGAEIVLAHVVPVPGLTRIGPPDLEDLELERRLVRRNERVASQYLDRLRARVAPISPGVRSLVHKDGDVETRLTQMIAEQNIDLVVLSAYGHTRRPDTAFGTVTAHLATHAQVPLLILRERRLASERSRTNAGARLPDQTAL